MGKKACNAGKTNNQRILSKVPKRLATLIGDVVELLSRHLDVADIARLCCAEQGTTWPILFKHRQRRLARQIEANVKTGDAWGWIFPPSEQCFDTCQRREGSFARFVMRHAGWSVFRNFDSFLEFDASRHGTFLIHDDDLRIIIRIGNHYQWWLALWH